MKYNKGSVTLLVFKKFIHNKAQTLIKTPKQKAADPLDSFFFISINPLTTIKFHQTILF